MDPTTLTFEELQRYGENGDTECLIELGRRLLDYDFHETHDKIVCRFQHDLETLESKLNEEIPPQCPHCSGWITDA